jgi:hypothetical protein
MSVGAKQKALLLLLSVTPLEDVRVVVLCHRCLQSASLSRALRLAT